MEYTLEFSHGTVTLNEEQFTVVTSPPSENQRILASAGSGKTTTITARIAYLVENYDIHPSEILLVSFSRSAAQEMIHRVHRLIGATPTYAGTFHALSAQILREQTTIVDQPFLDELPYRLVAWLETPKGRAWVKRFKTIIVDEFQDINEIQWRLLMGFYQQGKTMSIVGDDAQNIYTWRGSSVEFILDFHTKLPDVKDYQLCRNYRSTQAIVTVANAVMSFIPTLPYKEKMVAHAKGGIKPEVHFFYRAADEYDWVVKILENIKLQYPHFTCAVLSRYNSDLYKIEERLHQKRIAYNLLTIPSENKINDKQITLATIHASKGLEWDIVCFMNLHDDMFPSRKTDEDIICERRLFYVGVTRARKGLYLSYSRNERALSRFVREIPRPFLTFYNITSFKLSTTDAANSTMSLSDMLQGFDGADWTDLRTAGHIPQLQQAKINAIYPFAYACVVPDWVKQYDVRETWHILLRLVALRECALTQNKLDQLQTPEISEALLTLRIYKEDIDFWEQYEPELEHLVHTFLKHSPNMPAIEYDTLYTYVTTKLRHLVWSTEDMSHALIIISKIRGQLRPLRHAGFDLNEFTFGVVRNSVPTELRPDVLASWHRFIDKGKKTHDILGDIWRIAAIPSVIQGRNIPLYQCQTVLPHLTSEDHKQTAKTIESALPLWIVSEENPVFHFIFEEKGIRPILFDMITDTTAYQFYFDMYLPGNNEKVLMLLKAFLYEHVYHKTLTSIGFVNLSTGVSIVYDITSTIREQLEQMWLHLQMKYNLYAPSDLDSIRIEP
jgi:hypothetical protein